MTITSHPAVLSFDNMLKQYYSPRINFWHTIEKKYKTQHCRYKFPHRRPCQQIPQSFYVPCWSLRKAELAPDLPASWPSELPSCILSASPKASSWLPRSLWIHGADTPNN